MLNVSKVVTVIVHAESTKPLTVYERYGEAFPGPVMATRENKNKASTLRLSIIQHAVAQDRCLDEDEYEVVYALDHIIRNCP